MPNLAKMPRCLLRLWHLCWREGAVGIAPHNGAAAAPPSLPCHKFPLACYWRQSPQWQWGWAEPPWLEWQSIFSKWDTAASQTAESVVPLQLAFAHPCPLAPQPSCAPGSGGKTIASLTSCHRGEGPPPATKQWRAVGWRCTLPYSPPQFSQPATPPILL